MLLNWVGICQVWEGTLLPHELPVDHHGEMDVQDAVVVDGEAQNDANEAVLGFVLQRRRIKPKRPRLLVICEHSCLGNNRKTTMNMMKL